MEVIIKGAVSQDSENRSKAEVLSSFENEVAEMMDDHLAKRKLWFPSDFLPSDEIMSDDQLKNRTLLQERAKGMDDAVRVSVTLGLLTEEGLPHFHRLIATYLGYESVWRKWNSLWTAEEDRHGGILRDYARDSRLFNFRCVEIMQYAYQESGFNPEWDKDPYRVFAYTSLQERATQVTHGNTGKAAGKYDPTLQGILSSIASDEARHYAFYRKVMKMILAIDPNRALESALAILPSIEMPGLSMPNFKDMADVVRRSGIYGPWDYKKIVEDVLDFWEIESMMGLNETGRKAQEKLLAIPKRLKQVAEYIDKKVDTKSFSFDFIYHRVFAI
jgi:acyl-[acyl-carrier-protein] desaturase